MTEPTPSTMRFEAIAAICAPEIVSWAATCEPNDVLAKAGCRYSALDAGQRALEIDRAADHQEIGVRAAVESAVLAREGVGIVVGDPQRIVAGAAVQLD